jgi:hypothetical protein
MCRLASADCLGGNAWGKVTGGDGQNSNEERRRAIVLLFHPSSRPGVSFFTSFFAASVRRRC